MILKHTSHSTHILVALALVLAACGGSWWSSPAVAGTMLNSSGFTGQFQFQVPEDIPLENLAVSSVPSTFTEINLNTFLGANAFYSAGFTGQSTIVTNAEAEHIWGNTAASAGGTTTGHEALGHVTDFTHAATAWNYVGTAGDQVTDLVDRHATRVGMLIGGRNGGSSPGNHQLGIAYNTDLRSAAMATSWIGGAPSLSFNVSATTVITAYNQAFAASDVVNSSIGTTDATGTGFFAIVVDALSFGNRFTTFVSSAGNSGPGSNTVAAPGSGYNGITVAALDNANSYNTVASFSSQPGAAELG